MRTGWIRFAAPLALAVSMPAMAAGGHHAVDDAAILDEGQCELESWAARSSAGERLLHAGVGCRAGWIEWGAAADYSRAAADSQVGWALQAKWAAEVAPGVSAGIAVSPSWLARAQPGWQGVAAIGLLSWNLPDLALHVNLGRDLNHRAPDSSRWGVAAEWAPAADWTVVGERFAEQGSHYVRAGVRFGISRHLSLDVSRARRLRGPGDSSWTAGLTWLLERP